MEQFRFYNENNPKDIIVKTEKEVNNMCYKHETDLYDEGYSDYSNFKSISFLYTFVKQEDLFKIFYKKFGYKLHNSTTLPLVDNIHNETIELNL